MREPFWREDAAPFVRGGTYAGHPAACVAGLANLDILERERLVERAAKLEPVLGELLGRLRDLPGVADVRSVGLQAPWSSMRRCSRSTRPPAPRSSSPPAGTVSSRGSSAASLQISPPFVVTESELETIVDGIAASLQEVVPASLAKGAGRGD